VDFELSDDQVALTEGMQALCAGRFDKKTVRGLADVGGIDRALWSELAATGVFSLPLAEDDGGVGLGWVDAALVFEQLGRALVPGPLVAAALAAGSSDSSVEGVAAGDVVPTIVERPRGGGVVVVDYAAVSDVLIVLDDAGVWQVDPASIIIAEVPRPLDPLTPVGEVAGELPQGDQIGDAAIANLWRTRGVVLSSALQLGLAAGATDLAVAYAKEREQFGKPIGAFQAVKHLCADMLAQVEVARAAVYQAGVALDDAEAFDPERGASVARVVASEAGNFCGRGCIQVHGGMGYTWEIDAHLFLKRSWVLDQTFGTRDDHLEAIAAVL